MPGAVLTVNTPVIEAPLASSAELVSSLQTVFDAFGVGVKNKQPSVTVGVLRELGVFVGLGCNSANGGRHA